MSSGLVSMLLFLSLMQSNGGVSWFFKNLLFIFFGFFSYSCLYFAMAFLHTFLCVFSCNFSCLFVCGFG